MSDVASQGGLGIRIAQIPSASQNIPNSQNYIVSRLLAGTTLSQRIEVTNTSDFPMNVSLYPGAATNENGDFSPSEVGVTNELTSWTSVTPSEELIAPHSHIEAEVRIVVPASVHPSEQYGVIWAAISTSPDSAGVRDVNRVGVRMYDPVGNFVASSSTTSTPTSKAVIAPSLTHDHSLDILWIAIAILFIALSIAYFFNMPIWQKAAKKRRKRQKKLSHM